MRFHRLCKASSGQQIPFSCPLNPSFMSKSDSVKNKYHFLGLHSRESLVSISSRITSAKKQSGTRKLKVGAATTVMFAQVSPF